MPVPDSTWVFYPLLCPFRSTLMGCFDLCETRNTMSADGEGVETLTPRVRPYVDAIGAGVRLVNDTARLMWLEEDFCVI